MLAADVDSAYERARVRWPGVAVSREEFATHVRSVVDQPNTDPATLTFEDLFLALGCLQADARAVAYFESDVMPKVRPSIVRIDNRPDFVDEVQQRVRERLLVGADAKIADYRARGALASWVRIAAIRTALNMRAQASAKSAPRDDAWADLMTAPDTLDVELETVKAQLHGAFSAAVRAAVSDLSQRDAELLRMYFLDGYNIDRIGDIYGVHRSTAARWIHKAQDALHEAARRRLAKVIDESEAGPDTIERLLRSQLSISFSALRDTELPPPPG